MIARPTGTAPRLFDHAVARVLGAILGLGLIAGVALSATVAEATPGCTSNKIVCENQLPGSPASAWDIDGVGDATIQGFGTQMSVNLGERIDFKIDTDASAYGIQIFRLGYYGGSGARKIADVSPSATLPQNQPACATDAATEIYDCGTWGVSASWDVPTTVVSGVYIALLTRTDTGGRSQIPFIVRDDSSHADAVFQTSDATWQAYNTYGGSNFYQGLGNGRAYKLSYNRPYSTRGWVSGRDYLFANEYPMLRFLESNGYDLTYISSLDTDQRGADLKNHKIFVSTGHDEYWSQAQRDNVEAARDAGTNLAFFSGNEVYWKTRWEPSQDGTNTANRTLVCYKDTWSDQPLDPKGPTSTWRDARGAGEPENELTGTIYKANDSDLPLTVSGAEGKLRLWRNTGLGAKADDDVTVLAKHTVGYESDEDLDNGFRPAGTIRLSTTVGKTPQYLTDFGRTVVAGTTTHHLTMYRASSGALVFGAGTVQWAWGLDTNHDGVTEPVDVAMQQAMINLFADMSVQPASLSTPGLVAATKSTDTTAPTTTITSPTASATLAQGAPVTVKGTASDAGGRVGGVEVSLDGGTTWHPATGAGNGNYSSWTYTGILSGSAADAIQVRASDDSLNLSAPVKLATAPAGPYSLFGGTEPTTASVADATALTLGVRFSAAENGFVTGIRFYKGAANTGTHVGTLYGADGSTLASVTFTDETATGWQTATFSAAVPVTAGTTYVAAYTAPNGRYAADNWYFGYAGIGTGLLAADGGKKPNGVWALGNAYPNSTYQQTNYWVDVTFDRTNPTPLTVQVATPVDGAGSVANATTITAKLTREPKAGTLAFTLVDAKGAKVAGATAYDPATRTAVFTPAAPLAAGVTFTATVSATPADAGAVTKPASWSFTSARADQVPGICPCSLYDDDTLPQTPASSDAGSVELGTAFTTDTAGEITGIEFYKGVGNTGSAAAPHTVSLWNAAGDRLATATVGAETTTGWQTASFDAPVAVKAGQLYVASYRAPKGHYAVSAEALAAATDRAPLHTPARAGRFGYGAGAPTSISTTAYSVDPVFTVAADGLPDVVAVSPAAKSTSNPVATTVAVTFDQSVRAGSATITVTNAAGTRVAGATANQQVGTTVVFTPAAALAADTTYTVMVAGAQNLGGAAMASTTSTFTTAGAKSCPCTLVASATTPAVGDAGDAGAVTVGTRFTAAVNGYVTGLRYWRSAAGTGTHTGALYAADGRSLATITFADTDTVGWQSAAFDNPVAVTAGTTYTVAAFLPNGHYAAANGFFDQPYANAPLTGTQGVFLSGQDGYPTATYRNTFYYVDPTFALLGDTTAPKITSVKAAAADGKATISWTTDEAASSTLRYGAGNTDTSVGALTGTATGSDGVTSHTVTLTGLTVGQQYAYAVSSTDAAGNTTTADVAAFTVADATAPVISNVAVASSGAGAVITWSTSEKADGSIAYGLTDSLGKTVSESGTGLSHSLKISGLSVGKTYSYRITSTDPAGNQATAPAKSAAAATWTQQPVTVTRTVNDTDTALSYAGTWKRSTKRGYGDYNDDATTTAANGASVTLSFTGVGVAFVTETNSDQGQISVSVDGGAARTLDLTGTTRKAQQTVFSSGDLANAKHTIRITKLSGTILPVDAFVVTQLDTTAPVISSVSASGTGSSARITWKTDEAGSSSVAYGTAAGSLTSTAAGEDGTDHSVSLSGLTAGQTYYFKVLTADANGNVGTSSIASFVPVIVTVTLNDNDSGVSYTGTGWQRSVKRGYGDYNDDVSQVGANGASATLSFSGTAVSFVTEKSADQGNVTISIDGGPARTVSLYSASRKVQQVVFSATGLNAGSHTLTVTKASGTTMMVDAFVVTPIVEPHKVSQSSPSTSRRASRPTATEVKRLDAGARSTR